MFITVVSIVMAFILFLEVVFFLMASAGDPQAGDTPERDQAEYYDEDVNHLYYDRKLIARLKKERAAQMTTASGHK